MILDSCDIPIAGRHRPARNATMRRDPSRNWIGSGSNAVTVPEA